ncbi:MAG: modified peptide precursor CbpA [Betaproteobacteria bacterium]
MSQNVQTQAAANTETAAQPVAPTIAIRKSCNPDGIGLSHYVLMDKKAAK